MYESGTVLAALCDASRLLKKWGEHGCASKVLLAASDVARESGHMRVAAELYRDAITEADKANKYRTRVMWNSTRRGTCKVKMNLRVLLRGLSLAVQRSTWGFIKGLRRALVRKAR